MSFYSYRNAEMGPGCPGRVQGDVCSGLDERVCIQVKKVYDSCLQQQQFDHVRIRLVDVSPPASTLEPPLNFVSAQSTTTEGKICDLSIERLSDRPNFARVRCNVTVPMEVAFTDCQCKKGVGKTELTVKKDVILYLPDESIIPYEIEAVCSCVGVSGEYCNDLTFDVTICMTVILKIVAQVELVVPTYGFCRIPPCENFAQNVCQDFFGLPLFPPQTDCTSR